MSVGAKPPPARRPRQPDHCGSRCRPVGTERPARGRTADHAIELRPDPAFQQQRNQKWTGSRLDAPAGETIDVLPPWPRRSTPAVDKLTRFPIARLHYTKTTGLWTLYWRDRNLKYHRYDPLDPDHKIQDLLDYLDDRADPSSGDNDRLTWSSRCTDRLSARPFLGRVPKAF